MFRIVFDLVLDFNSLKNYKTGLRTLGRSGHKTGRRANSCTVVSIGLQISCRTNTMNYSIIM